MTFKNLVLLFLLTSLVKLSLCQNSQILVFGNTEEFEGLDTLNNIKDIKVGGGYYMTPHFIAALRHDGSLFVTGSTLIEEQIANYNENDIIQISAGWEDLVAVKSDSTIITFGERYGVPNLSSVKQVAAGWSQHYALHYDGTVSIWGDDPQSNFLESIDKIEVNGGKSEYLLALRGDTLIEYYHLNNLTSDPNNLEDVVSFSGGLNHYGLTINSAGKVGNWGFPNLNTDHLSAIETVVRDVSSDISIALDSAGNAIQITGNSFDADTLPKIQKISVNFGVVAMLVKNNNIITTMNKNINTGNEPYPNPTNGEVNLFEASEYSVLNSRGDIVQTGKSNKLDLKNFDNGLYLILTQNRQFKVLKQ